MTVTFETVEPVTYTAQQNRRYARKHAGQAVAAMIGRSGLTAAEKLEQLQNAQAELTKAQVALALAIEQAKTESADEQAAQDHVFEQAAEAGF